MCLTAATSSTPLRLVPHRSGACRCTAVSPEHPRIRQGAITAAIVRGEFPVTEIIGRNQIFLTADGHRSAPLASIFVSFPHTEHANHCVIRRSGSGTLPYPLSASARPWSGLCRGSLVWREDTPASPVEKRFPLRGFLRRGLLGFLHRNRSILHLLHHFRLLRSACHRAPPIASTKARSSISSAP